MTVRLTLPKNARSIEIVGNDEIAIVEKEDGRLQAVQPLKLLIKDALIASVPYLITLAIGTVLSRVLLHADWNGNTFGGALVAVGVLDTIRLRRERARIVVLKRMLADAKAIGSYR